MQDVEELLEAGISVLTSINLEYIAEQQEFVRSWSSARREPRPSRRSSSTARTRSSSSTRRRAMTPRSARNSSLNFAQRALLLTADVVDRQLEEYLRPPWPPVVVGHAGTDSGLHDAASQRGQHAGQRTTKRRSLPRRTLRDLRHAGRPDGGGSHGDRAERHAGSRPTGTRRRRSTGKDPIADDPRLREEPRHHADLRRSQPPPHLARPDLVARRSIG